MTQEKLKKVRDAVNILSSLTDEEWKELEDKGIEFNVFETELSSVKKEERKISQLLKETGISCHLKGYRYLVTAIFWILENNQEFSVTKVLYPYVAKKFNTTPSRVERAMRHAIEVAWERGDIKIHKKIFGTSVNLKSCRPTVHETVCCLAEYVKLYLI